MRSSAACGVPTVELHFEICRRCNVTQLDAARSTYYENLPRGNELAARSMTQWREQMFGNDVMRAVGPSCDCAEGNNANNTTLPLFESFPLLLM